MASRFRDKLNGSYCLVKVDGHGWTVGKIGNKVIFITYKDGGMKNICDTDDTDLFRYFLESIEYQSKRELFVGDKVNVDKFGPYYVVDIGHREKDGSIKYLIAR